MGYYNNNGRGYNNNRDYNDRYDGYNNRGYDNRRGYNDRGYNNNRDYDDRPQSSFKYAPGQKCRLVACPSVEVSILRCGREQYECRCLSDLKVEWFYEHELELVEE